MEAHSGQESFITYAQRHSEGWRDAADKAQSWQEFHAALATYGVEYTLRGNGAVFVATNAKATTACKASSVARELSKAAMGKKFGEFIPAPAQTLATENMAYARQPLTVDKLARQQYEMAIKERREALAVIQKERKQNLAQLRLVTSQAKSEASGVALSRRDRGRLVANFYAIEKHKKEEINQKAEKLTKLIEKRMPFSNWPQFVQWYEEQGNEPLSPKESPLWKEFQEGLTQRTADLDRVFQRRKNNLEQVNMLAEKAREDAATVSLTRRDRSRLVHDFKTTEQRKQQEIIKNTNEAKERIKQSIPYGNWNQFLQWKAEQGDAKALLMLRKKSIQQDMSNIKKQEKQESTLPPLFASAKVSITKQGTVVIRLDCGEIRDTGDTLFFRGTEDIAKATELYAEHKWGKETKLESGANYIRNVPEVVRKLEKMEAKALKEHERTGGLGL